ncbi:MAG: DnaJ domain-containing protein [Desulfosarcina sp.]|nr:DnaJ domain-containing protein [Desulfobacterales bacterium]
MTPTQKDVPALRTSGNACLSCGTRVDMGRRRYCSVACRQRLRHNLQVRTGLLKALNTRYATFYFDERIIVLDILPYGTREIYSYLFARHPDATPAEDFSRMANALGNVWWDARRRTHKKYLASRSLLRQARQDGTPIQKIMPEDRRRASVKAQNLVHLKIQRETLDSPDLVRIIKKAYRLQAKRYHPDLGGTANAFRKLQKAYEALMGWAEIPSFYRRRGFPDKWFYDGRTNRWVQPIPAPR